ncbi:hypothetical protein ACIA49_00320 [Kribbella sp. NPDC051587]|uniref:hypothetical protein n=1 Tax=Kribbella sp. NPDC051587 TaxID=3364119 RepID=UPI00378E40BD
MTLLDAYTGGRWGELAGQTAEEYDALRRAIGVFKPLKEVEGRLFKGGVDVTELGSVTEMSTPGSRRRRTKRSARTKSPAGERWVQLPPSIASIYELLLATSSRENSFAFLSLRGAPWYRSNFRQRFWRPAWDGVDVQNPGSDRYKPAILDGFRFHEGRHTHATWLTSDGISEVGRRARLGQKMKGMARVYDHVTPEMEQQILDVLEARFVASVLELTPDERHKLLSWVPVIEPMLKKAVQEAEQLAAKVVRAERFSQISPTGPSNENRPGGESAL